MPRRRRPFLLSLLALVALLAAVPLASAQAAERQVPFGFFGTTLATELTVSSVVGDAALEEQTALMATSGVESLRAVIAWGTVEPARGLYDFSTTDRLTAAAARHGLVFLPNISSSPRWASRGSSTPEFFRYPPRDPTDYANLMRQMVLRYGPRGTFWAQNPGLPRRPIRQWQIWNEQSADFFWKRPSSRQASWAPGYTQLLKESHQAIKGADPRATIAAGALVGTGTYTPWAAMRHLYSAGARRWFDVVGVHPFTQNPRSARDTINQTLEIVRRVRREMRARRDARKKIILTEMTWPASVGSVPRNALLGIETTPRGQAQRLRLAYRRLSRERRSLGVTQAYWFTWASEYTAVGAPSVMSFRYSGLTRFNRGAFSRKPILRTYSDLAARYQGCRKSDDARRCR
jgi:Beta-galactosidase